MGWYTAIVKGLSCIEIGTYSGFYTTRPEGTPPKRGRKNGAGLGIGAFLRSGPNPLIANDDHKIMITKDLS